MSVFRVGIIGTGGRKDREGRVGSSMAYHHANGYERLPELCEMVACADIVEENRNAFAERYGVTTTYADYHEMLAKEDLDIVSVCTWPHLHEQMVIDCAAAGPGAIHCEKPMASTWGGARRMAAACAEKGVRLTFNHMRRFGRPFRTAKKMLDDGEIGRLLRLEFGLYNLCDYGSHQFDMCGYFNDQVPALWAFAQIDYRTERRVFGAHQENEALALWKYENGVYGMAVTGEGTEVVNCHNKLIGTEGVIEIGPRGEGLPVLRVRKWSDGEWTAIDCGDENCHAPGYHERGVEQIVRCLADGTKSELCAENVLQSTELIFACWESARRRGRVELPLDIDDNPLDAMVESGDLTPAPRPPG